jgi:hypothetical protein
MPLHHATQLENLLLADKGDLSSVRIADFGLAKAVFESTDDPEAMNAVCGTPAYGAHTMHAYTHACCVLCAALWRMHACMRCVVLWLSL